MVVLSKGGLSAAQAERYYQEKYSQDDYYSEDRAVVGQWYGKGAERLGLHGDVQREDFHAVLHGRDPSSGDILVEATHDGQHRAGWDATFNAPKSVSMQALAGGDERLWTVHRRAADRALAELERSVQTRQHGGQERVNTENMVAARFDHVAARPSHAGQEHGYGPDPHLHTHVVIANLTQRADGQWRALEPLELYRSQEHATAVYRSELAKEVQRLGYALTHTGQKGEWELAGYSRTHITAFSQRRQDIEQHLVARGLRGAGAAQIAAHQTRLAKDVRDETTLRTEWQDRAGALGLDLKRMTVAAQARAPLSVDSGKQEEGVREAVAYAREHHTEREAVVDSRALEASALHHGMGTVTLDHVRAEMATQRAQGELIAVQSKRFPQGGYTTRQMVTLETENIRLMQAGKGQAQPIAQTEEVRGWAQSTGLTGEQTRVAVQTLTARDWLTAIEGKAGATKTTTIGAIRDFAETRGYAVQGYGPTTGSVRALAGAGVTANTVASLNAKSMEPGRGRGELWIIDESSLLSTRQTNTLLHHARTAEVERVILVGDQQQHGAVEAGRPITQMQRAGMTTARLEHRTV
jgi:conjugative relaxase-like TrwC/TraI family protein